MKIEQLIQELQKELARGHTNVYLTTDHLKRQLYPNALYDIDLGIEDFSPPSAEENFRPVIVPTRRVSAQEAAENAT